MYYYNVYYFYIFSVIQYIFVKNERKIGVFTFWNGQWKLITSTIIKKKKNFFLIENFFFEGIPAMLATLSWPKTPKINGKLGFSHFWTWRTLRKNLKKFMEIVFDPKNVIPSKLDLQPPSLLNEKYFKVCLFFLGYVTTSKKSEKNQGDWCHFFLGGWIFSDFSINYTRRKKIKRKNSVF